MSGTFKRPTAPSEVIRRHLAAHAHLDLTPSRGRQRYMPAPDDPPLRIGDYAALISGGPISLVTDCTAETVTLTWQGDTGIAEAALPRGCVRRVGQPSGGRQR